MKRSFISKLKIYLYFKYCKLSKKRFFKKYIVVFKYGNTVDYFLGVCGINKKEVIKQIELLLINSDMFDIKSKNDVQIIAVEVED